MVDDEANRKALYARFMESQKYVQDDPWKKLAEGEQAYEFEPIKVVSA